MLGNILTALGICGTDLAVKSYMEKNKDELSEDKVLGGAVILRRYHNHGAFLNLGEKHPALVAALSVFLTVFATFCFICTAAHSGNTMLRTGLSILLGGAYSNTYDRLKHQYVVDYVSFGVPCKGLRQIVFNIGDFAIMIGALLIALNFEKRC